MSHFGFVVGHLPLLHLPVAKLSKLGGHELLDLGDQLRHNCIRMAWLKADGSSLKVRPALDYTVGHAAIALAEVRGQTQSECLINTEMEHARRENEWWSCFGFFLEDEVQHLLHWEGAGPVLRSLLPPNRHALDAVMYAELLKDMLASYRENSRADRLSRDTAAFVRTVTKRHDCIESLPEIVAAYFDLADLLNEEAEVPAEVPCNRRRLN